MTTALFPLEKDSRLSYTATIKAGLYPALLADIAVAGTDAKDSLDLFVYLCKRDDGSPSTPGFMAFDAHVGDTSCHVRAAMFWTLRDFINRNEPCTLTWHTIELVIQKLSILVGRAKHLCRDLTVQRSSITAAGLNTTGESRRSMLEKLGWYDLDWETLPSDSNSPPDKDELSATMNQLIGRQRAKHCDRLVTWDPKNVRTVIQFVIYCYKLSKYKSFCRLGNNVGARLDPEMSLEIAEMVMEGFWNTKCPNYTPWKNKKRVLHDLNAMQNWLSELSCAWLIDMGKRDIAFGPEMIRLPKKLIRVSSTGLYAIPSYIGWLVIRSVLAETSTPVLLVDKRFCKHGFHINYFLVKLGTLQPGSNFAAADSPLTWSMTRVSAEELLTSDDMTPHYSISGNSLDGDILDFMQITSSPVPQHKGLDCGENLQHCLDFLSADQDAIALASLTDHRHYAFPLINSDRDELALVADEMNNVMPGLSEIWRKQKDGASALGTSTSMRIFNWQHVVLETVGRVAAQFESSDGLSPVMAPVK